MLNTDGPYVNPLPDSFPYGCHICTCQALSAHPLYLLDGHTLLHLPPHLGSALVTGFSVLSIPLAGHPRCCSIAPGMGSSASMAVGRACAKRRPWAYRAPDAPYSVVLNGSLRTNRGDLGAWVKAGYLVSARRGGVTWPWPYGPWFVAREADFAVDGVLGALQRSTPPASGSRCGDWRRTNIDSPGCRC